MTKQRISSIRQRINKDNNSFSAFTAMGLMIEFQAMDLNSLVTLRDALLNSRKSLSYDALNNEITKRSL